MDFLRCKKHRYIIFSASYNDHKIWWCDILIFYTFYAFIWYFRKNIKSLVILNNFRIPWFMIISSWPVRIKIAGWFMYTFLIKILTEPLQSLLVFKETVSSIPIDCLIRTLRVNIMLRISKWNLSQIF